MTLEGKENLSSCDKPVTVASIHSLSFPIKDREDEFDVHGGAAGYI